MVQPVESAANSACLVYAHSSPSYSLCPHDEDVVSQYVISSLVRLTVWRVCVVFWNGLLVCTESQLGFMSVMA